MIPPTRPTAWKTKWKMFRYFIYGSNAPGQYHKENFTRKKTWYLLPSNYNNTKLVILWKIRALIFGLYSGLRRIRSIFGRSLIQLIRILKTGSGSYLQSPSFKSNFKIFFHINQISSYVFYISTLIFCKQNGKIHLNMYTYLYTWGLMCDGAGSTA